MRNQLAISAGIFCNLLWPAGSGVSLLAWAGILVLACAALFYRSRYFSLPVLFALGLAYGLCFVSFTQRHLLPDHLDKQEVLLTGSISSLVQRDNRRSRFTFDIDEAVLADNPQTALVLDKVLLSVYGDWRQQPGERWQFSARLSRPRGFANQAGMDYAAWLVEQGYSATGYTSAGQKGKRLADTGFSISRVRQQMGEVISGLPLREREKAVLAAITLGDRDPLSPWWDQFARLGIVHLLVISGLHIGLVAGLGFFVGRVFARLVLPIHSHFAARWAPPLLGILSASVYAALAGFSLPTQRALIAVLVVMLAQIFYRRISSGQVLAAALLAIALFQPAAPLSSSFWLTFSAVAVLVWWFSPWRVEKGVKVRQFVAAQLALSLALTVPLLALVGRASWLAPVVNLVAVPWMSFITVPLSLMGALLHSVTPEWAQSIWILAGWSLRGLFELLDLIPAQAGFFTSPIAVNWQTLLAALLMVVALLLPARWPMRWLGVLPLLILLIASRPAPPLKLSVLDVGQGLAVLVETPSKVLVYDTGAAFSERFDAGSGIVAPYLWAQGRQQVDKLIISHEDGDHFGGYEGLAQNVVIRERRANRFLAAQHAGFEICEQGVSWRWDEVNFEVLAPPVGRDEGGNNNSCVLLISWRDQQILLPGDIERWGEFLLLDSLNSEGRALPLALLVAPHHGSRSSSTPALVTALQPLHVVYSAGYRHRFGHPHPQVQSRYRKIGTRQWNTAVHGAIYFSWSDQGRLEVHGQRQTPKLWWH